MDGTVRAGEWPTTRLAAPHGARKPRRRTQNTSASTDTEKDGPPGPTGRPAQRRWQRAPQASSPLLARDRLHRFGHDCPQLLKRQPGCLCGRTQQVRTWAERRGELGHNGPQSTAKSIAHNRTADLAADGIGDLRGTGRLAWRKGYRDRSPSHPLARAPQGKERVAAANPPHGAGHRRPGRGELRRQLVAALEAPGLEDGATGARGHPVAEAMVLRPFPVVRLVGALHPSLLAMAEPSSTGVPG